MRISRRFHTKEQAATYAQDRAESVPGQTYYVLQTTLGRITVANDCWGWQILSTHRVEKLCLE